MTKIFASGIKPLGCTINGKSIYLSANLYCRKECGIILYDSITGEEIDKFVFDDSFSIGNRYSVCLDNVDIAKTVYRYFEDDKVFADKYSKRVICLKDNIEASYFYDPSVNHVEMDSSLQIDYCDSIFYLLNVRGLTKADSKFGKYAGTFKALEKSLDRIASLSVTSLILMPVYTAARLQDNKDYRSENVKDNLWGFGKAYHYAIDERLAYSDNPSKDFSKLVKTMHSKGMECILIMNFLNESSEYILDVLKYYKLTYNIDGFRLVGAGIDYDALISEPLLTKTKLLFSDYDFNYLTEKSGVTKHICDCGDRFLKESRALLKGDEDHVGYFSYAIRQNSSRFASIRNITDFSGFTLYDLVSYNRKHNEDNLEQNQDGTDYNYSWNCGYEGFTNKRKINNLRNRQLRNAYLLMALCQNPPMILAGDEFLNSNLGNNNPYCQDNEIGWVVNRKTKETKAFNDFCNNLFAFRKRHIILHQPKEVMLFDYISCKVPDVSFHSEEAYTYDQTPVSRSFSVLYSGDYARQYTKKTDYSIYVIYNLYWEEKAFSLPLSEGTWKLLYSTDGSTSEDFCEDKAIVYTDKKYISAPRSITIFIHKK